MRQDREACVSVVWGREGGNKEAQHEWARSGGQSTSQRSRRFKFGLRFFAIPGSSDYKLLVLQIESVVQAIYNLRTSEAFSTKFIFGYSRFLPLWDGWP
jgi:hypothetical protein